jgi:hypothetical protein
MGKAVSNALDEKASEVVDSFIKFRSCGLEEIKLKVMAEPEKYKENSVFIANKE